MTGSSNDLSGSLKTSNSPVLRAVTDRYGKQVGIDLTPDHEALNQAVAISLVASTGGVGCGRSICSTCCPQLWSAGPSTARHPQLIWFSATAEPTLHRCSKLCSARSTSSSFESRSGATLGSRTRCAFETTLPTATAPAAGRPVAEALRRWLTRQRIFDVAEADEFYLGFLGFTVDWDHRFDENAPLYPWWKSSVSGLLIWLNGENHRSRETMLMVPRGQAQFICLYMVTPAG